ncbi:chemokine-like receptor 1 [Colossoma macropomum]|uniref:chemokine-like receptor 1 n=1 Tax=Colossoma macropomum TaxID=42526 RepID=UPI001863B435|nr:chemokine-like receptor 1 [Colossoma macropomum]
MQDDHLVSKTVEMTVHFRRSPPTLPALTILNRTVMAVESRKVLGTTITRDLKWDSNISSIINRAKQRIYFLRQLRKFNLPQELIMQFYTAITESIITMSITVSSGILNSTPMTEPEYLGYENHTNLTTVPPPCRDVPCIFYAAVNVIIFILGVAGNGLVIWIAGFKVKKSVNATWYLRLAVSDIIFCSFLPIGIVHVIRDNWIFGLFMCKFLFFLMFLNWFSSIFLLVIISVDRCVVVMFPVWAQNKRTVRKASVIVMLAWIISAALSLLTAFHLDVKYDYQTQTTICHTNYKNDQQKVADVVCRFIFGFLIPYLIIIICYVVIIRKLKSNQTTKSKKPFKIMTVLIVTFLICWLPYNTFALMELDFEKYKSFYWSGSKVILVLANANSCLNPFFFCAFMGKDFKDQCYALLSKIENAIAEEEDLNKVQGTVLTTSGENKLSTTV